MIVDSGKKELGDLLIGATPSAAFAWIAVGDGGDDTSTSQTELDNEISRKAATVTRVGNTLVYNVTFTGSDLTSNLVRELGIFNKATKGASNEVLLTRVNFNAIGPLTSSDSVAFIFRLEVE